MKIEDFIQGYVPNINTLDYDIENFNQNIYDLKEFRDLELSEIPSVPEKGKLLPNQEIIKRFMGSFTPYNGILLFNEVGVGKTCSSVGVAEQIREYAPQFKRALVLLKGKTLMENYINELVFVCTDGRYVPENFENLTSMERTIRTKKMVSDFYEFGTFETFAKRVEKMRVEEIQALYNNSIVIIDEVHNLKGDGEEYKQIYRFLHTIQESKIMVMSATPMTDKVEEIADIMNLILPSNLQLPTGEDFKKEYIVEENDSFKFKEEKVGEIAKYFTGRVSYLKAPRGEVRRIYEGKHIGKLRYFKVYPEEMDEFQAKYYLEAFSKDKEEKAKTGIYSNSRQASLLVYPDGSYGGKGFTKYVKMDKKRVPGSDKFVYTYSLDPELKSFIVPSKTTTQQEKLENLKKLSIKYYSAIKNILENRNKLQFIYSDLVEGSGLIVFSKLLELFGYSNTKSTEDKPGLRYAIFTNKTITPKQIKSVLKTYNSPENMQGEYIHVIMGSSLVAEGLSFKNVQDVHIFTPHWNYSETEQAVGRAIRLFSHKDLINAGIIVNVRIYHHVAIADDKLDKSIDLLMYEYSERKDVSIKSMERVIERLAFDCQLTKERNEVKDDYYDGSRLCEYQDCDYQCYGITSTNNQVDVSNYDKYYIKTNFSAYENDIRKYFGSRNYATFNEIKNAFPKIPKTTLLSVLESFIRKRIEITSNTGFTTYLAEENDKYYLTENKHVYSQNFGDNYYINHPVLTKTQPFSKLLIDLQYSILPSKIDKLIASVNKPIEFTNILKELPDFIKESLIENCILAESLRIDKNILFRNSVLTFFSNFIVKKGNVTYSTLVKPFRCFDGKEWKTCSEESIKKLAEEKRDIEKEFEENPYGYYGILDKAKDKFMIRDVSRRELIETEDARKKSTGKACNPSWDRADLVKIAYSVKLPIPEGTFKKEDKDRLIELTEQTKYKNAAKAYSEEELKEMDIQDLKRVVYYASVQKAKFCEIIKKWFEDNNLLLIK